MLLKYDSDVYCMKMIPISLFFFVFGTYQQNKMF